jgi:hypothetical protein
MIEIKIAIPVNGTAKLVAIAKDGSTCLCELVESHSCRTGIASQAPNRFTGFNYHTKPFQSHSKSAKLICL